MGAWCGFCIYELWYGEMVRQTWLQSYVFREKDAFFFRVGELVTNFYP